MVSGLPNQLPFLYPAWCRNLHRIYSIVAVVRQFVRHSGGCHAEGSFVVAREGRDKVITFASTVRAIISPNLSTPGHLLHEAKHQLLKTKLQMLQNKVLLPMFPAAAMNKCPPSRALCTAASRAKLCDAPPEAKRQRGLVRSRSATRQHMTPDPAIDTTAKIPAPAVRRNHCSHRNCIVQCKNRITRAASLTR